MHNSSSFFESQSFEKIFIHLFHWQEPYNYRVIYERIINKCILYNITIYGANGQDLKEYFGWNCFGVDAGRYFRKNEHELKQLVSQYDAVSFDLFDTLIMRKTLEPADVFDIVEDRIEKKG